MHLRLQLTRIASCFTPMVLVGCTNVTTVDNCRIVYQGKPERLNLRHDHSGFGLLFVTRSSEKYSACIESTGEEILSIRDPWLPKNKNVWPLAASLAELESASIFTRTNDGRCVGRVIAIDGPTTWVVTLDAEGCVPLTYTGLPEDSAARLMANSTHCLTFLRESEEGCRIRGMVSCLKKSDGRYQILLYPSVKGERVSEVMAMIASNVTEGLDRVPLKTPE